jgi:opine dehydrogenase
VPATLLNIGRIESTSGSYPFWLEGMTRTPGRLAERLDAERLQVAAALGASVETFSAWLTRMYGVTGTDVASQIRANGAYAGVRGPQSLDHRFITEDVPMGLVPMAELGRGLGVATPAMDTLISLAGLLVGADYRREGRTPERLGLAGMDRDAIRAYVAAGEAP